jgi:ubiquinone/menaquinone biosynthesis C-methylase UbiE
MEIRKQKEIEYYDKKSQSFSGQGDFEGFDPFLLTSYQFLKEYLKDKCQNKRVLDYGCGNGIHSDWLSRFGAKVIGIDLSEKSLEIAKKKVISANFLLMDCEKLEFPDNYFDIVFDGGTFSSLDIKNAYPEISRVLKPNGFLIGIETLGHNPLANLKRMVNRARGKRTDWAASHILRIKDLKQARDYFNSQEVYYFHLFSILAIPFLKSSGKNLLLNLLEKIDKVLLSLPFLKRFALKAVFIFRK